MNQTRRRKARARRAVRDYQCALNAFMRKIPWAKLAGSRVDIYPGVVGGQHRFVWMQANNLEPLWEARLSEPPADEPFVVENPSRMLIPLVGPAEVADMRPTCPKCGSKDFHSCMREMRDTWVCYGCDQEWFKGDDPDTSVTIRQYSKRHDNAEAVASHTHRPDQSHDER